MNRLLAFLKSTFSEPDGTGSASRVLGGSVVGASIVWISYIVFTTHHLPDLGGAAAYVTAGFSGYGMNKISCVLKRDQNQ